MSREIYRAKENAMATAVKPNAIRGALYKDAKRIVLPQWQASLGGDKRVPHFFSDKFWARTNIEERPIVISLTEAEWKQLARRWKQELEQQAGVTRPAKPQYKRNRYNSTPGFNQPFASAFEGLKVKR